MGDDSKTYEIMNAKTRIKRLFGLLVKYILYGVAIAAILAFLNRFLNGPRDIRYERRSIDNQLSNYINTYYDDEWCIKIPLDEAQELINIIEEQRDIIEEQREEIYDLTHEEQDDTVSIFDGLPDLDFSF